MYNNMHVVSVLQTNKQTEQRRSEFGEVHSERECLELISRVLHERSRTEPGGLIDVRGDCARETRDGYRCLGAAFVDHKETLLARALPNECLRVDLNSQATSQSVARCQVL